MISRGILGTLAIVVAATLVTGGVAPQPAQADDTGRIIAGIAAGALVYGLLGDGDRGDRRADRGRGHDYGDRGFYSGNSGSWSYQGGSRYQSGSRHGRGSGHQSGPPRRSSRQYERGYDHGWHDGYGAGFGDGHDVGYGRGWNRGYDRGYDRGRTSNWGCWGGWGF